MIPRVLVALPPSPARDAVLQRLRVGSTLVESVATGLEAWSQIGRTASDLLLVHEVRLPPPAERSIETLARLPDAPAIVILTAEDEPALRARLLQAGGEAVLVEDTDPETLVGVVQAVIARRGERVQRRAIAEPSLNDFVSISPVMQAFMHIVRRVADSDVAVLMEGETGVGKERLARALHRDGPRATGAFVAINCGALPESLLESELFGHEQGAFTGATRSRRGCFELADGGTLFLDEIGEVPVHLQVKLLRALQEREIQRVGAERSFRVDVRIIAATNRNLPEAIAAGAFRRDLYYRLNVLALVIPPLRERSADIPSLVHGYLDHLRPRVGRAVTRVSPGAMTALQAYDWPGNVRELINVVERAMLLCSGDRITTADLPFDPKPPPAAPNEAARAPAAWLGRRWAEVRVEVIEQAERAYLTGVLEQTRGRVGAAAALAGISPRSLFEKMRRHGLDKAAFRR